MQTESYKEINTTGRNFPKVIFMDDSPVIVQAAKMKLKNKDLDVTFVKNLKELEERLAGDYFAAIIDLNMPEIGGVAAMLKIAMKNPQVNLIAFTGHDDTQTQETLKKKGIVLINKTSNDAFEQVVSKVNELYSAAIKQAQEKEMTELDALKKKVGRLAEHMLKMKKQGEEFGRLHDELKGAITKAQQELRNINKNTFPSNSVGSGQPGVVQLDQYFDDNQKLDVAKNILRTIAKQILPNIISEKYEKMIINADKVGGYFREHQRLEELENEFEKIQKVIEDDAKLGEIVRKVERLQESLEQNQGKAALSTDDLDAALKDYLPKLQNELKKYLSNEIESINDKIGESLKDSKKTLDKIKDKSDKLEEIVEEGVKRVEKVEKETKQSIRELSESIGGREGITPEQINQMVNSAAQNIGVSKSQQEELARSILTQEIKNIANDSNNPLVKKLEASATKSAIKASKTMKVDELTSAVMTRLNSRIKDATKYNWLKTLFTFGAGAATTYIVIAYFL